MISINIICIGKLKEKYLVDAINEYSKRLSTSCKFSVIELAEERLSDNPSQAEIEKGLELEGKNIIDKMPKGSYTFSMCIEGKEITSEDLSKRIEEISFDHSTINFVIGGSFGLSNEVKDKSDFKLSMGKMTFPHQLARVMLTEQIYRAFQISKNTHYHK